MKAAIVEKYGEPDVFVIKETEKSKISANEMLVKVECAGVNPIDTYLRQGKLQKLMPLKFPFVVGNDFSGIIVEVGASVTQFKVNDKVYGRIDPTKDKLRGSYAEFLRVNPSFDNVAIKPTNLTFEEAAGAGICGLTAYCGLVNYGKLQKDQKILIIGASGGVGYSAVQMAKHLGAKVTAVCSGKNKQFVLDQGADTVVDYTYGPLEEQLKDQKFDIVYDCVLGDQKTWDLSKKILNPKGTYVTPVAPLADVIGYTDALSFGITMAGRKLFSSFKYHFVSSIDYSAWKTVAELIEQGKYKIKVCQVFPIEQAADAHKMSQTHRAVGKIILKL